MGDEDSTTANILIVDDHLSDLNLLTNLLIDHPYKLRRALLPSLALNAIQAAIPDLVLLDVNMPEMSGYEVCERIKSDPKTNHIPVIFVSASDMGIDKERAFKCGGSDYISKPYQFEEVLARIENQLQIQQSHQKLKKQKSKLEVTLLTLRRTQHSLLESERQATLGRIVDRITRDIAQPMGLIHNNVSHVCRQCRDMQEMLTLQAADGTRSVSINELEYINADLGGIKQIADSIYNLSSQLQESIKTLQTLFDNTDEEAQEIHLNHTLGTLITALERLWKSSDSVPIKIEKKYGKLSLLKGHLNSLNQAIFLILNLVTDMISTPVSDMAEPASGYVISLETHQLDSNTVELIVRHNGPDLSDTLNQQIKSPFTSVKAVSNGQIGQSLSVIRQVMLEKWKGDLFCQSCQEGMALVLKLPIYPY